MVIQLDSSSDDDSETRSCPKSDSESEPEQKVAVMSKENRYLPKLGAPGEGAIKRITRFGYVVDKSRMDNEQLEKIRYDLTVTPFKGGTFGKIAPAKPMYLFVEKDNYLIIPKYYALGELGAPEVDELRDRAWKLENVRYTDVMRPNQQVIVDKVIKGFETQGGGLLIAGCGSGKTNMAIYIACHFRLKTLFIVHKTFLKNQIMDRIRKFTNIDRIGTMQGKKVDIDPQFVVGMVQSLSQIDYDHELFKDFGMVIIDEVHHMGSRCFSKVFKKISARYMLGISAERTRNDRMYGIINWYMGPILHFEEQKPNSIVVVKRFNYSTSNDNRVKMMFIRNIKEREPDRSTMVTNLLHIKRRNRFIVKIIKILFDEGKNILFLTGRLKHIDIIRKVLSRKIDKRHIGCYLGGMPEAELAKSATCQVILGTYDMAQEGLDIGGLNVVILGTPKSSIKQSVGRITRKEHYEEPPIVIDLIDEMNFTFKQQGKIRLRFFEAQKYRLQDFSVADFELEKHEMWNDKKFLRNALLKHPEESTKYKSVARDVFKPLNINAIKFRD